MKTLRVMTMFALLYSPSWSSDDEKPPPTIPSPHTTPFLESNTPAPDALTGASASSSSSSSDSEEDENSEDLSKILRGLNALNLSVPRLEYTLRSEQLSLQYDLCYTIQRLQQKISHLEEHQTKFQLFYQEQIYSFQREMNKMSLCLSHLKIDNRDLLEENERLQNALFKREGTSSTDTDANSESSSDSTDFSDGEDFLGTIKASPALTKSSFQKSTPAKHTLSSAADFGIPPLNLQAIISRRYKENY